MSRAWVPSAVILFSILFTFSLDVSCLRSVRGNRHVEGLGFGGAGCGLRVSAVGCLVVVSGFGLRVSGFGFRVSGFGCQFLL